MVFDAHEMRIKPTVLVREKVVEVLRQAIRNGVLQPGRRLTERELTELTGVSRTSVREALRHLQAERLVEASSSRGLRVVVPTEDEVRHIYEVRAELEPLVVALFAQRASQKEIDALLDIRRQPTDSWDGLQRFDELLLTGSSNPVLREILNGLYTRIHALRQISISIPGRCAVSKQEFDEVVAAIERRCPEDAAKAARRHVKAAQAAAFIALKMLHDSV
ncbi:GntR family transcriptional regulator [Cupriavidus consociatus]|uniref:GntR family transcriptional regulator n=1 Tax=Cupriavidus consociatus TaxID=2821357 RepID=UPI001AE4BC95|nr:GntR family transcriptional regulator [Cupriavidus sp. LEh21]MBP0623178.1 GntR family transcriptional regulator [Cupriavidus sp. LEh25]MDK2659872.1 GntR family transcriptional regulator [Cupriavidus sp. LEh21]